MTSADVFEAIRKSRDPREWAVLPQLANGTGSFSSRTADAVAMSLWPSRGMEVHGFEIKVSRGDWLRELKAPEKAESIFTYCDRWFVVIPNGSNIVRGGELPPTWGLYAATPEGGLLPVVVAPSLQPKALDRTFVAAVMRSLQKCQAPQARIDEAENAGYQRGLKEGRRQAPSPDRYRINAHRRDLLYLEQEASRVLQKIRSELKPLRVWEPDDASIPDEGRAWRVRD